MRPPAKRRGPKPSYSRDDAALRLTGDIRPSRGRGITLDGIPLGGRTGFTSGRSGHRLTRSVGRPPDPCSPFPRKRVSYPAVMRENKKRRARRPSRVARRRGWKSSHVGEIITHLSRPTSCGARTAFGCNHGGRRLEQHIKDIQDRHRALERRVLSCWHVSASEATVRRQLHALIYHLGNLHEDTGYAEGPGALVR